MIPLSTSSPLCQLRFHVMENITNLVRFFDKTSCNSSQITDHRLFPLQPWKKKTKHLSQQHLQQRGCSIIDSWRGAAAGRWQCRHGCLEWVLEKMVPSLEHVFFGVSVTFLVGVFVAARYSKLNTLHTLALMNGFAKTVYDYLKCRKERKAEAQNPWFVWSQSPAMWLIRPGHYLSNTNWKLYWILYSLNLTIICHALTMLCMLSMIFCHLSDAMLCVMLFQYPACCKWYFL